MKIKNETHHMFRRVARGRGGGGGGGGGVLETPYNLSVVPKRVGHFCGGRYIHYSPSILWKYIGIASIAPIHLENPRFRGNRHSIRNPSSPKDTYGQNMGVLKKMTKIGLQESC